MLLACYSHKHISYRIRTIIRKAIVNRTTGLVDYKELEANILSSIREGRPLTGRDGAFTPFIKKLLEASLEGEIENHLLAESEERVWLEEVE